MQEAHLKGWCGTIHHSAIPPIWKKITEETNLVEVRSLLVEAFEEARKALRVDLSDLTEFYFEDSTL